MWHIRWPVSKMQAWHLHCNVCKYLLWLSNMKTLLQQASEWGMCGMQGIFPRCKKHLSSDDKMRCLVIGALALVHNF
jgi:hypothetical protein